MGKCPCQSHRDYSACCGLYIEKGNVVPTAEALMRSRYTAYSLANIDYIQNTMQGKAAIGFDKASALKWATETTWHGLKVIQTYPSKIDPKIHYVEFVVQYMGNGQKHLLHELSEFHLENGKWYYVNGKSIKTGRNEPCYCKSGLKYKKCCGQNSVSS